MTVFHAGQTVRNFEKRYTEAISKQASITLKITKCTTIGPPRKGKTCLKYLLTGHKWDVEAGTASTDVMEAPEWVECYSLEEEERAEELWKLLSPEQQKGKLFQDVNALAAYDTYSTTTSSDATTTSSDDTPSATPSDATTEFIDATPTTTSSDVPPTSKGATPTITSSDVPPTTKVATPTTVSSDVPSTTKHATIAPPPTTPAWSPLRALEAIAGSQEKLEDLLKGKEGQSLSKTRLVHFIDTGGQAIYHDVHPVLITSPSVYLVVFSLEELYQKKNDKEPLSYFRSNLIQRPLRSIYTFGTKNPQKDRLQFHPEDPTICIVGTHLDKIPGDQCEEFLKMLHDMISEEISSKPYREFVQYDPEGRSFWAVDNTLAGRDQSEAGKEYVSTLRGMVQDRSMEMSVDIPLTWMLLKFFMEGKGVRYCKYSELLDEARKLGYVREDSPDADLDTMLRLFHILSLFYHKVPKGCKKEDSLVFIDPDCLYSATSDFLMAAKEEIEDGSKDQHRNQAVTREETEDSQGGSEEGQHQTQAVSTEEGSHDETAVGIRQQKLEWKRIVAKSRVIQRMKANLESIKGEMDSVLQNVKDAMATIDQVPTDLERLCDHLKEIGMQYKGASMECPDASSVKAKWQLFISKLVLNLASSVKAVLNDSEEGDIDRVREKVDQAVKVTEFYQSRSINSSDLDQFLAILSDLRIVAKLSGSDSYVVPAALPKVPPSEIVGNAAPILITVVSQTVMEVCYLPSGLFCCLINELVTDAGWTVDPLGRTHVAFTHKNLTGKVHVLEHESYIEIKVESQASLEELSRTCQSVRETIHKHVVHVCDKLYSGPTADSTFEESLMWGFHCEEHPDDNTHIAAFEEGYSECYAECLLPDSGALQPVSEEQRVWSLVTT